MVHLEQYLNRPSCRLIIISCPATSEETKLRRCLWLRVWSSRLGSGLSSSATRWLRIITSADITCIVKQYQSLSSV